MISNRACCAVDHITYCGRTCDRITLYAPDAVLGVIVLNPSKSLYLILNVNGPDPAPVITSVKDPEIMDPPVLPSGMVTYGLLLEYTDGVPPVTAG